MINLDAVIELSRRNTDISDSLLYIYEIVRNFDNPYIVECGVRSGYSTAALLAAVNEREGYLDSIDIIRQNIVFNSKDEKRWNFYLMNDLDFIPRQMIDVLFIDTEHIEKQLIKELYHFEKYLKPHCLILFHDTNEEPYKTNLFKAIKQFLNNHLEFVLCNRKFGYGMATLIRGIDSSFIM